MTRKRRYLMSVAVLVAGVGVALGVLAMLPQGPGVTKANFDRIENGMTIAEANAILGEPTLTADRTPNDPFHFAWNHQVGMELRAIIYIEASKDRLVTNKEFQGSTETFTDKLRRWLHLPK